MKPYPTAVLRCDLAIKHRVIRRMAKGRLTTMRNLDEAQRRSHWADVAIMGVLNGRTDHTVYYYARPIL